MPFFFEAPQFDGEFLLQIDDQSVRIAPEHLLNLQLAGHILLDCHQAGRHVQFAIGKGVEGVDGLLGQHAPDQLNFDFHLFRGVIVDRGDF